MKTLHDVVTVPTAAIQRGAPGTYVYVVNANNTVSVRPIKIGPTDGPMAAVSSGLSVGERVVIDGTDRLRDGAHVTTPGASNGVPAARSTPAPAAQSQGSDPSQNRRNSGRQ
jgi:multidrug efflux system membrane fusion protein